MRKSGVIFDKKGNAWLPRNLKFPGHLKIKLRPVEWLVWIFLAAEGPEELKKEYARQGMSRQTFWRAKKKLKAKGFL